VFFPEAESAWENETAGLETVGDMMGWWAIIEKKSGRVTKEPKNQKVSLRYEVDGTTWPYFLSNVLSWQGRIPAQGGATEPAAEPAEEPAAMEVE
jgi:hypothetical protein